jgi:hypothetical protein
MLYRNRVYHPTLGRFVQRDPIGYEAGDLNLMRYVGNRIIIFYDYLGLVSPWFPIGEGRAPGYGAPLPSGSRGTCYPPLKQDSIDTLLTLCEELNSCKAKQSGCSRESCKWFVNKIADAMAYANYQTSGLSGWLAGHGYHPSGMDKCHLWTRFFQDQLEKSRKEYVSRNRSDDSKVCLSYPRSHIIELEHPNFKDHSINTITNRCTGNTLCVDDGFWGDLVPIYNPQDHKNPPLLSEQGKVEWNNIRNSNRIFK